MGKLRCICDNTISTTLFPNQIEGDITGAYEWTGRGVWECDNCGRLWIDDKDEEGLPISKPYFPERGKIEDLFKVGTGEELIDHLKKIWRLHKDAFRLIENGEL
jgi:hypothetical protein